MNEGEFPYEDIVGLPHHQSARHPHMSMHDRAAQFSAFAALTGHDKAIKETERVVDSRIELDEDRIAVLDEKLQRIQKHLHEKPKISITYFVPDNKKSGGSYVNVSGSIRKIDVFERKIIFEDGTIIPINDIIDIKEGIP